LLFFSVKEPAADSSGDHVSPHNATRNEAGLQYWQTHIGAANWRRRPRGFKLQSTITPMHASKHCSSVNPSLGYFIHKWLCMFPVRLSICDQCSDRPH
jgi:hypothetical protein